MHLLTLIGKIDLNARVSIAPGTYVGDDINCAQLMSIAGEGRMTPWDNPKPFDETKDWNGKSILLVRAGGYGDLVLMTPISREIKRRWPQAKVDVSCMQDYAQVLEHLPTVDRAVHYPVPVAEIDHHDAIIVFENAVEKNPRAHKIHMTDLFAEIAGLTAKEGTAGNGGHPALDVKKPDYVVTPNEAIWLTMQFPRQPGKRRLCLQGGTSALCRIYPSEQYDFIVKDLLLKGWEVFLMGAKHEINGVPDVPGLVNLTAFGATFRQSCAVINSADAFLGGDSALLHVAGALGIPAVGLYGPFLASLRTAYCPTTFAFQGKGPCAPCFHHPNATRKNHFPADCPSRASKKCGVLADIKPKPIIQKIEQIAKKPALELVS